MTKTFKHSGNLSEIIFALPTIRALGGGILYLDPAGGESEPLVKQPQKLRSRTRLDADSIESLRPLLALQEYIVEVRNWSGENVDFNLDLFRKVADAPNISDAHLKAFGMDLAQRNTPWLRVDRPVCEPGFPLVFNRTTRHIFNQGFWEIMLRRFRATGLFVGHPKEHEIFEYIFGGPIRYYETKTVLDLARVLAGCERFFGNASLAHAIAEAMKKPTVLEVYRPRLTANFDRPDALFA